MYWLVRHSRSKQEFAGSKNLACWQLLNSMIITRKSSRSLKYTLGLKCSQYKHVLGGPQ